MTQEVDVLILGAGPAGSAAAITLRRWLPQHSTLQVARLAGAMPKVGETLTPGIRPLLEFLGLGPSFDRQGYLAAGGTASAWGSDQAQFRSYLFGGLGHGWQIDRGQFEAWLQSEASARGAGLLEAEWSDTQPADSGFVVRAGGHEIRARFLVDASGRSAKLARALGAKVTHRDSLFARAQWFNTPEEGGDQSSEGALIASIPDGWWYTARLPGGRGIQALMTDAEVLLAENGDPAAAWRRWTAESPATEQRVRGWQPAGAAQTCPAGSQRTEPLFGPGWVAAGDAAAAFDPLASLGIGFALSAGIEAARVIASYFDEEPAAETAHAYAASVARIVEDYHLRLGQFYGMERRWDTDFWRSRSPGGLDVKQ